MYYLYVIPFIIRSMNTKSFSFISPFIIDLNVVSSSSFFAYSSSSYIGIAASTCNLRAPLAFNIACFRSGSGTFKPHISSPV